jgi:hypothetical protein
LRNFRTLMLKTSSFMVPPFGSNPLKIKAGDRRKSCLRSHAPVSQGSLRQGRGDQRERNAGPTKG